MRNPYKPKIDSILLYIKRNIAEDLSVSNLAERANMSPFHFHRIYSSLLGETIYESILRLRMEHAIFKLSKRPKVSVIEIALEVGFQNPSSFTRAFKKYFGFTPSDVLQNKIVENSKISTLKRKYGKELSIQDLYPEDVFNEKKGNRHVKVEIKNYPERSVIALSSNYTHDESIDSWLKLHRWYRENKGTAVKSWQPIGLYYHDPMVTPLDKCQSELCVFTEGEIAIKEPFKEFSIPDGKYAVCRYEVKEHERGKWGDKNYDSQDFHNHIQSFYKNWVVESGYEADKYPLMMAYNVEDDEPILQQDGKSYFFDVTSVDLMLKLK